MRAFCNRLGPQRGGGVHDDDIDRVGAGERLADGERLLAGIGLRHEQVVEVHAELLGVAGVERVLGVNERREAAGLLRVDDDVEHERGLAGGFRDEDLDDPSARHAAHAEREVNGERAGGNHLDGAQRRGHAESHDGAFAVAFRDGGNGGVEAAPLGADGRVWRRFLSAIKKFSQRENP